MADESGDHPLPLPLPLSSPQTPTPGLGFSSLATAAAADDQPPSPTPPPSPSPIAAAPGLGRRLLGAIGLASPSNLPPPPPPGAGAPAGEVGLGVVLHLKDKDEDELKEGEGEEEAATHGHGHGDRDTNLIISTHASPSLSPASSSAAAGFGVHLAVAATHNIHADATASDEDEDMVHTCSDSDATSHQPPALEEGFTVPDVIPTATSLQLQDTDAKVQRLLLLDQNSSGQCEKAAQHVGVTVSVSVGEELVLEQCLGGHPTHNMIAAQNCDTIFNHHICAANGNDIALEGRGKAAEQCTSAELGATVDNTSAVQHQVMVQPQATIDKQCAIKDATNMEDLEKAVKRCGVETENIDADVVVEDQELVKPKDVVGDEEKAMEQCAGENSTTINHDDALQEKEKVMEQQGWFDSQGTTKDGNAVEYQEVLGQGVVTEQSAVRDDIPGDGQEKVVQQCTGDDSRSTMDDNAVGDHDIPGDGHEKVAQQCTGDDSRSTMDDNAVGDLQVLDHDAIDERSETKGNVAVKYQEKAPEQCTSDEMGGSMDDNAVLADQEVLENDAFDGRDETTKNIAVKYQEKVPEQCTSDEMGGAVDDNAMLADQEVMESDAFDGRGETTRNIIVKYQEKAPEQCTSDELGGALDDNAVLADEEVVEQEVIGERAETTGGVAVKYQEMALEQCTSDEMGGAIDDNVARDQEVVEQEVIDERAGTTGDIVVMYQEKALEQCSNAELGVTVDDNGAVGGQEVVEQDAIVERAEATVETAIEDQELALEQCSCDQLGGTTYDIAVENQVVLEQDFNGERGETIGDIGIKYQEGEFTVEKHKKVVEHVRHEWGASATEDGLAEGGVDILSPEVDSIKLNGSDRGTLKETDKLGYPQRPGKLNCPFYMSTGSCSYGLSCHFDHPMLKAKSDVSSVPYEQGNHRAKEILELNRIGLPIREGARNCTYYMRNGTCGYGKKCHYNHPDHAQFYPPTGWEDNALPSSPRVKSYSDHALDGTSYLKKSSDDVTLDDTSYSKRSSDHATLDDTSYSNKSFDHANIDDTSSSLQDLPPNILRMLLPLPKAPPTTEGKTPKVQKDPDWSSVSDDSDGCCSADSSEGPLCKQEHVDYPERPDRPECPGFSDCKFVSVYKHHHSKDRLPSRYNSKDPSLGEELMEYPERPGEPECPFYMKSRFCKFGAECKFHHPKDLTPSRRIPATTKKSVAAANEHHPATRVAVKDHVCQQQQYPERPGQPDCRYYLQFGKCKFLSACIFHHPKDRLSSEWHPSDLSQSDQHDTCQPASRKEDLCQQVQIWSKISGTPECPFYMKTGTCRFGSACEFRHPKDRCSSTEEAVGEGTDLACDSFTRPENVLQQQDHTMYPERPSEPDCSYYMRHGYCKYQLNCRFHHPRYRSSKNPYGSSSHS